MERDDFEIGAMLGASVRAIQDAQMDAERSYLEFMLEYGLEEVREKQGDTEVTRLKLREVSFDMARQVPDPANPGQVVETTATVRAPLLSLIQMPAIGIQEATVAFDLDVETDVEASKRAEEDRPKSAPLAASALRLQPSRPLPVLKGSVGSATRNVKSRKHGRLNVKLTLRTSHDDDLHGRIVRLIGEGLSATVEVPENKG